MISCGAYWYELVTPPVAEPLTLAEAKAHLRVEHDVEDSLISMLISAAREYAENFTRRALMTQTWRLHMDDFPGIYLADYAVADNSIYLEHAPLQSVTHIKYIDQAGTQQTVTAGDYIVEKSHRPRIVPGYLKYWALPQARASAVEVEFVAGYLNAAAVPIKIKQAMMLLIGQWYQVRENIVVGTIANEYKSASADMLMYGDRMITV